MFGLSLNVLMIVAAVAGSVATFGLGRVYDNWIDDPRVAREARREYVAIAELEAEREIARAQQRIAAHANARAATLAAANEEFSRRLSLSDQAIKDLIDEIAALESAPAPDDCRVNDDILDRLRNR